jgi:N-acylneuraminate cytidylyltransferase
MFVYIPARGGSQRLPRKNIRRLGGKPVLAHVIDNLKALPFVSRIHVSTDDPEIAVIAEERGAQCLGLRDSRLADSQSGFTDLIRDDIPRYIAANGGDAEVLFVLATAALVPPEIYRDAHEVYRAERPEILMSCETYSEPPWWALQQKPDGFWYPMFPDKVSVNSQDLPPAITDSGLFYFFDQEVMRRYDCHKLADRLKAYVVPHRYRCDINDEEDWERLEWKFGRLQNAKS